MPWTEDDNRVCGSLLKKNKSGTWIRRFLVLNFSERILKLYTEDVEVGIWVSCPGPRVLWNACSVSPNIATQA